jgi:alpha-1,3-rhamnosyl/mannosyltransferase
MKVVIDATPLLLRSAGVKSYLYHWIGALRALAGEDAIGLFPRIARIGPLDHERSVASPAATLSGIAALHAANYLRLPTPELLCRGARVFHCSNQLRRPPRRCLLTATLHDATCWKMPEFHTSGNILADRRFAREILARAAAVIAVSESTRRDAIELLGLHPGRVVTIHNGVSESFFRATDGDAARVRAALKLDKPYVLALGTVEPRKNLDRLLDAWLALRPDLRASHDLVVAGPAGWGAARTLARLESDIPGVRRIGYVPEADLPGLTRGASVLAYPSLYEGFGFPLAQAMACGVAAITSNVSSLPEIAGGAARLADPLSVAEIAAALEALLGSPAERARLGALGRRRALEHFRWNLAAEKSLALFRSLAA